MESDRAEYELVINGYRVSVTDLASVDTTEGVPIVLLPPWATTIGPQWDDVLPLLRAATGRRILILGLPVLTTSLGTLRPGPMRPQLADLLAAAITTISEEKVFVLATSMSAGIVMDAAVRPDAPIAEFAAFAPIGLRVSLRLRAAAALPRWLLRGIALNSPPRSRERGGRVGPPLGEPQGDACGDHSAQAERPRRR
jgi:hypothetical protein